MKDLKLFLKSPTISAFLGARKPAFHVYFFFIRVLEDTTSYQQTRQVADVSEAVEKKNIFPLKALKHLLSRGKMILLVKGTVMLMENFSLAIFFEG